MTDRAPALKMGYVVKMFPRLSETFILNEILELERRGVEVVIFSIKKPNEGRFHPQVSDLKARVLYLEDLDTKKWPQWIGAEWPVVSEYAANLWGAVGEAMAEEDPGRVEQIWWGAWVASQARKLGLARLHAHFASMPSTVAYFAHRVTGIPFSFTAHAKDIFVYTRNEHYLREKLAAASFVVTVTSFNKRYLVEYAPEVDADKIKVIHNGIDLKRFKSDGAARREPELILGVGRLVPKKGFGDLLDACAILKKQGVPYRCLIVGGGVDAEALEEKRRKLRLDEVTFTGPRTVDEVRQLMRVATVFCLPCTVAEDKNVDALPTVLLEALACGLPAVSTTISGVPEIVETGVDGLLVEPDRPAALAEEIERLLSSPDLRARLSKAGRKKAVDKFDLQKNVKSLVDLYLADTAGVGAADAGDPRFGAGAGGAAHSRVLYVCADRGIPFGGTKGSSIHVREFLEALQSADLSPTVVAARRDANRTYTPAYPVHTLPRHSSTFFDRAGEAGWSGRSIVEAEEFDRNRMLEEVLADLHRREPFDFVYERYSLFGTAGRTFSQKAGLPFVLEVNAPLVLEAAQYRDLANVELAQAVEEFLFSTSDHITAVSEPLKDYILNRAPGADVTVIPNAVNLDRFNAHVSDDSWRSRLTKLPDTDFVIGFVGSIRPWHGVELLIDVLGELTATDDRFSLCLVGNAGAREKELVERCEAMGLHGKVTFTGAVAPEEIPNVMRGVDVLVAPYPELRDFYFSPLKVYEYMAAGKPIVASAIGQITDILTHEKSALLVPAGDTRSLAAALRRIGNDPVLCKKLGEKALSEVTRKHSWRQRIETVTRILEKLDRKIRSTDKIGHADTI
ncbi:MAG: glycosyltransferase family 4 protein [Candidatus Krumholzibacteriia bacterium]